MITTILFDMGGTLEELESSQERQAKVAQLIQQMLVCFDDTFVVPEEIFRERLLQRYDEYKAWCTPCCQELKPEVIWGQWALKDFEAGERIGTLLGENLADLWEGCFWKRSLREDAGETLRTLRAEGYRLGIISNTSSLTLPIRLLNHYGIEDCFEHVFLSSVEGIRKPETSIFLKAADAMHAEPGECFYVGDQIAKDVKGSIEAGFAGVALIGADAGDLSGYGDRAYRINCLSELVNLLKLTNK